MKNQPLLIHLVADTHTYPVKKTGLMKSPDVDEPFGLQPYLCHLLAVLTEIPHSNFKSIKRLLHLQITTETLNNVALGIRHIICLHQISRIFT